MQPPFLITLLSAIIPLASAAGKTHIYIDEIPLYTSLQQCAQDRVSAIVRAQELGCGDNMQLTSFSCFCIDSSTQYASIISTAVQSACGSRPSRRAAAPAVTTMFASAPTSNRMMFARRASARNAAVSGPLPTQTQQQGQAPGQADATSAVDAFRSYCARSTELSRFASNNITPTPAPPPPTSLSASPSSSSRRPSTKSQSRKQSQYHSLLAAIVVPSILIPVVVLAILLVYLSRRRLRRQQSTQQQEEEGGGVVGEKGKVQPLAKELGGDGGRIEMFACDEVYEKEGFVVGGGGGGGEAVVVELDGGFVGVEVGGMMGGGDARLEEDGVEVMVTLEEGARGVRPVGWV
ncbi:hypothetical protein DM02DRAFT_692822 [Periconia macrospinosa]|uniref:Extracellular membrane protein CFEM domain-containing protein n=1 Tax=Periconia macrospinosa TaxID=97972 RepID=A0A2V1E539_9PLEO|nr:hypothetical protein DM02DRAFT_692822 [Periconia macrospinosa]